MNHLPRARMRHSLSRVAIAGVAGLASFAAVSPVAVAADELAPDSETSEASTPEVKPPAEPQPQADEPAPEPEPEPVPEEEAPEKAPVPEVGTSGKVGAEQGDAPQRVAALAEEDPVFVEQSIVVRVVPGESRLTTSTVGSTFDIVVTDADGVSSTSSCITDASTLEDSGASSCLFDGVAELTIPAGASVEVTMTSAPNDLTMLRDRTKTVDPATESGTQELTFYVLSPGPHAGTDSVETDQGVPVVVDAAANDLNVIDGATITLDPNTPPFDGTAELVDGGTGGTQQIRYTPNEDYSGSDEIGYYLTTSEGSSFALVTVQVNAAEDVEPNYGTRKYRVAADIEPDAYVPAGTTTAGSTFTIVTTAQDGTETTTTCTSQPVGGIGGPIPGPAGTASACAGSGGVPGLFDYFTAPAGATVTVTQASAPANLLAATNVETIEPCDTNVEFCGTNSNTRTASFLDKGSILPDAVDDTATTEAGKATTVDVLANDTSDDPEPADLSIDDAPEHGTATVIGSPGAAVNPGPVLPPGSPDVFRATLAAVANEGSLAIRYTPAAGFSGTDTFTYALANSNGAATAQVTLTVRDGQVVDDPDDDNTSTDSSSTPSSTAARPSSALPSTGGLNAGWLGLGALLLAAGAAVTAWARRRTGVTLD